MRTFSTVFMIAALAAIIGSPSPASGQRRGQRPTFDQVAERFDANRDGKITREEFRGRAQMFDRMDRDRDGVITKADFEGMSAQAPRNAQARRGMSRFQDFLVAQPAPGQEAPDFQLRDLDGKSVSLKELLKTKPVVLEFGSFT